MKNFIFLSGLPRTGSTLLSSILNQNPEIYSEGSSGVCQLMWDMKNSIKTEKVQESLKATNRKYLEKKLIKDMVLSYYDGVKQNNIIDKGRSWTLDDNVQMILDYITNKPKIIVMVRPLEEVIDSYKKLRKSNGWDEDKLEEGLFNTNSEILLRCREGVIQSLNNNPKYFHYISYKDLVEDTEKVLSNLYEFLELPPFKHNLNNIVNYYPEIDDTNDLQGFKNLHDVRPTIGYRK